MFSSPEAGAGLPDVQRPSTAPAADLGSYASRRSLASESLTRGTVRSRGSTADSRPTTASSAATSRLSTPKHRNRASLASAADTPVEFLSGPRDERRLNWRDRARERHTALIDRRTRQVEEIKEEKRKHDAEVLRTGHADGVELPNVFRALRHKCEAVPERRYDAVESDSDSEAERGASIVQELWLEHSLACSSGRLCILRQNR